MKRTGLSYRKEQFVCIASKKYLVSSFRGWIRVTDVEMEINMNRPITTLFMLMSVDGKISPGASDNLDSDKDFPAID